MTTPHSVTRHDITFPSGDSTCAGWLHLPTGLTSPPVAVLGHGLGATREMRLDAFTERCAQAGIAAVAFTYRHFGHSGGHPRQLLSIKRQLVDWDAALAYVHTRRDVDRARIAIWGSSVGGGHAIATPAPSPPSTDRERGVPHVRHTPFALAVDTVDRAEHLRSPTPPA
ncbi:alpha/beta hydrolase [Streptomyces sp. NPDC021056]|uniref:alpha/beta hydrolase n=1 Tax=Streptomyces sp. NPDC021056 TaxID=3155012 RepID=UPI0033E8D339